MTNKYFMLQFPADQDTSVSVETGEQAESPSDENDILANQDETVGGSPQKADAYMGGMGSKEIGTDNGRFARGEIDLVEQMGRTTRRMDAATGRTDDPFEGYEIESNVDPDAAP